MKRTIIAAATAVLAIGLIGAATPASADTRLPAAVQPHRVGLGDDVYLYHPILQSVLQTPPLDTLIRFRMEAYTNFYPQAIHIVVHLYWWRSAKQLHRVKGAWVEIHPTVRYGAADLPAVGTHQYLSPPADWTCETGRFYIRVHVYGITHTGRHDADTLFFPWAGFTKKDLKKGNNHKRPALKEAWQTECKGGHHDTLIG